ncbi:MAG: OmpA family protein, partial [Ignavibacteria bacterium]|nr:OmpA family protein [Ignavibacteria bacterium]
MYLRYKTSEKLSDFNHSSAYESGNYYLGRVILVILIVAALALMSSLSNSEVNSLSEFQDSLNTEKIYFDFGKSELKPESFAILDRLTGLLKSNPELKIEITGHTDNIGSDEFNLRLSVERAEAVKNYLLSKGCSPKQIITQGKGKSEPVTNNSNNTERSLNRRVEFRFIYPEITEVEDDILYANVNLKQSSRNEFTGEISVRDSSGEPVDNITDDDISAYLKWKDRSGNENILEGHPRLIPIDDKKKIAFTLTMDYSGSMFDMDAKENFILNSGQIPHMENAVKTFINMMDERMFCKIIKFGSYIDVIQNFTENKQLLLQAVHKRSKYRRGTALYRSIYEAITDTTFNSNPSVIKTVIAFTDGMENSSQRINLDSVFAVQNRYNTKVYTV